jgi:hypothetical protein
MGTLLEIVLLLVVLSSFFLAYMSAKVWRIYLVVIVEFVFLAAVTFSYMATRTLQTQKSWREAEIAWKGAVDKVEKQNHDLQSGKEEQSHVVEDGIEQLKAELDQLVNDRGNAWFNVLLEKKPTDAGVCQLSVEMPEPEQPHEIAPKTILFVFDNDNIESGGHYLGEFKVTKAQAKSKSIEIEPNLPLTEEQRARLQKTKGKWSLYAMMPVDDAELFGGMDEAERQKLVPKASLKEFASKKRTLRDYEYFFHEYMLERELIEDAMTKTNTDLERTLAADKKAQEEITYRKSEKADLASDLKNFNNERQAVTKYAQTLEAKAKALKAELNAALAATARDAHELNILQLKAAQEIDRKTADQASNGR